jgi:hypothetical protein
MTWLTITAASFVALGAVLLLTSMIHARDLFQAISFVPERSRTSVMRILKQHRLLMFLFLVGYLIVVYGLTRGLVVVNELLVGAIFFLVAVFIWLDTRLKSKLFSEIQNTLHGLLPICAKCKRILSSGSSPEKPGAWMPMEAYISEQADVHFTHGYCPECTGAMIEEIDSEIPTRN